MARLVARSEYSATRVSVHFGIATLLIALLSVSYQAVRAAVADPV
jgi:hypothetical protein